MCIQNRWSTHRLDGDVAPKKRVKLVEDFNRPDNHRAFCFLLSSKAGGCGLNIIGANRLVMFDPDWNPANDRQAFSRVWRDGQNKSCFIYRLFTTGTIDEKVYQRQICKDGLATMMMTKTDGNDAKITESLSADQVKDLFTFSETSACSTHDMMNCQRCGDLSAAVCGVEAPLSVPQTDEPVEDDLHTWSHNRGVEGVQDSILTEAAAKLKTLSSWTPGQAASSGAPFAGVSFTMACHIERSHNNVALTETANRVQDEESIPADSDSANHPQNEESNLANFTPPPRYTPDGKYRLCEHGQAKKKCRLCSLCPHNMWRSNCTQCSACPHGKRSSQCAACKAEKKKRKVAAVIAEPHRRVRGKSAPRQFFACFQVRGAPGGGQGDPGARRRGEDPEKSKFLEV